MKNLYFIRHGQTLFNKLNKVQGASDSPLTQLGEKASSQLGLYLKENNIQFDTVYTSDLGRARQTAKRIVRNLANPNTPLIETRDLREVSFGSFEGGSNDVLWAEASKAAPDLAVDESSSDKDKIHILDTIKRIDPLNLAESFEEVSDRIARVLDKARTEEAENLLFVSHGLFINTLLYILSDQKRHVTTIPNTSVTKITYEQGEFTIVYIGRVENL
ncbi:histidine phosphatase family protein [Sporolactobacillus shoreicorticis]|uniref:Histidine phosphatase family protein n=1 Tax=Sporolactobacillus shoreicorticis TaxID=1923877 RepID=A0ABW5SCA8_9BACL|nr:histidine phosphatase family protein [Sporolactobacillus shoreicorticis]MCO7127882.1 histidine phosphatase family protein [Sporolactobacillus shoreicorticis]